MLTSNEELEIGAVDTREGPYLTIDIHEGSNSHRSKRSTNRVCSEEMDQEVRILEYQMKVSAMFAL